MSDIAEVAPTGDAAAQLSPQEAGRTIEIVVVLGHDDLGLEVCRGLVRAGKCISAVWAHPAQEIEIDHALVSHIFGDARRAAVLSRAGIRVAQTVLAITGDDQLNLRVALAARDLNPKIRIVLRQFNRWLGRKIVANLRDSDVASPETFSAATFAASCLNASVYQAIEFPRYSEQLFTFCRAPADEIGCVESTVRDVDHTRRWKVLAINDRLFPSDGEKITTGSMVTFSCMLEHAPKQTVPLEHQRVMVPPRRVTLWQRIARRRYDPVLVSLFVAFLALLGLATVYFNQELGLRLYDAWYFVVSTVTTTGSDIGLLNRSDGAKAVGMLLMVGGIGITGTLLAYLTAFITRRSLEFSQGRHAYTGRGHIIVCGFGNVGARVTQYLLNAGQRVVVIDRKPDEAMTSEVRARGAHVMTADATSESAQEMARVAHAAGLLSITDNDSVNLEAGLTALAYAPALPIIMRIADPNMAKAVERHFRIRASYSAAALAAPLITGLALAPEARGTVDIVGRLCVLSQRARGSAADERDVIIAQTDEVELVLRT